jgi:hypothetical protein
MLWPRRYPLATTFLMRARSSPTRRSGVLRFMPSVYVQGPSPITTAEAYRGLSSGVTVVEEVELAVARPSQEASPLTGREHQHWTLLVLGITNHDVALDLGNLDTAILMAEGAFPPPCPRKVYHRLSFRFGLVVKIGMAAELPTAAALVGWQAAHLITARLGPWRCE